MTDMDPIEAAHAVLIEVGNVLGAFRDDFVVVGGWVPELRYPNQGHMGTLDVDVAVARTALGEKDYSAADARRRLQPPHGSDAFHQTVRRA